MKLLPQSIHQTLTWNQICLNIKQNPYSKWGVALARLKNSLVRSADNLLTDWKRFKTSSNSRDSFLYNIPSLARDLRAMLVSLTRLRVASVSVWRRVRSVSVSEVVPSCLTSDARLVTLLDIWKIWRERASEAVDVDVDAGGQVDKGVEDDIGAVLACRPALDIVTTTGGGWSPMPSAS